ncbi:MAG: hypothetical protein DWH78_06450, partial [Planctomycetota bacterium]
MAHHRTHTRGHVSAGFESAMPAESGGSRVVRSHERRWILQHARVAMNAVRVIRAGLCTTVQDLGRLDMREFGVPVAGAMDLLSHELANRLVGNSATAATLEMTLTGDELEWPNGGLIAVTGAEMSPTISVGDSSEISLPMNRPVVIPAGARIRFRAARRGCRCY